MAENNEIEFGKFLKSARLGKKMTLGKLGEKIGYSGPYLSQIENGKKGIPAPDMLKKISEALGIDYSLLMSAAGYIGNDSDSRSEEIVKQIYETEKAVTNYELEKGKLLMDIKSLENKQTALDGAILAAKRQLYIMRKMLIELEEMKGKENKPAMPSGIVFGIGIGNDGDSTFKVFKDGIEVTDSKEKELLFKKHQIAFENSFIREGKILDHQREKKQDKK